MCSKCFAITFDNSLQLQRFPTLNTFTGSPRKSHIKTLFAIIFHRPLKMNKLISPLNLACNPPTHAQTACRIGQKLDYTFFIQKQFAKPTWLQKLIHQLHLGKHHEEKYRPLLLPGENLQCTTRSNKAGKLAQPASGWELVISFLYFRKVPKFPSQLFCIVELKNTLGHKSHLEIDLNQ